MHKKRIGFGGLISLLIKYISQTKDWRKDPKYSLHDILISAFAIDESEYFSSEKIHCPGCLYKKSKKRQTRYHYQSKQSVMIHPNVRQVLPLAPESITNSI